jgi:hypothetical protein
LDWRTLLQVEISGHALSVQVGWVLIGAVSIVAAAVGLALRRRRRRWRLTKVNFRFAGLGQIEICPSDDVAQLAHTAWVELRSRKAAMPFDEDNDVIVEVYNSYYDLFKALRELAKTVPVDAMEGGRSEPLLAEIILRALNDGLRPHLTIWQAKFRRWYEAELADDESKNLSPQQIQRRFPEYNLLIADLRQVSAGMSRFTEALRQIAHDRKRAHKVAKSSIREVEGANSGYVQ